MNYIRNCLTDGNKTKTAREVPKELIDLLYYDVKDKDETETLEDIERDILSRRQNPTYTSDYDLEGYSAEQIKYAIMQIDRMD